MAIEDQPTQVMLVDDHQVLRDGLRFLLEVEGDIVVVGEAGTGQEAIAMFSQLTPDVVVVDLGLPDISGLELIPVFLAGPQQTRVVVLSMHISREYVMNAVDAGCHGYVPKSSAHSSLLEAIRVVMAGERYLHPKAASALVESLQEQLSQQDPLALLSERELTVVTLTAMGFASREIGLRLNISPKTVDTYRQRAMEKLEIENRPDLLRFALQHGLLDEFMQDDNPDPT